MECGWKCIRLRRNEIVRGWVRKQTKHKRRKTYTIESDSKWPKCQVCWREVWKKGATWWLSFHLSMSKFTCDIWDDSRLSQCLCLYLLDRSKINNSFEYQTLFNKFCWSNSTLYIYIYFTIMKANSTTLSSLGSSTILSILNAFYHIKQLGRTASTEERLEKVHCSWYWSLTH